MYTTIYGSLGTTPEVLAEFESPLIVLLHPDNEFTLLQPYVDANLKVQMSYYNYHLALWEPVLEPVETRDIDGKEMFLPWELKLTVCT